MVTISAEYPILRDICADLQHSMWIELHAASEVARLGTLSDAARSLGVHRATVARHVEALEVRLGAKLFHRHARGYSATELGHEVLRIASATTEQMKQLETRARGLSGNLSGDFVLTSIDALTPRITPVLRRFAEKYPRIRTRFIASQSLFRLEYGEAHVAVRLGPKPSDPDNVVRSLGKLSMGLYASQAYCAEMGTPQAPSDFDKHRFVALEGHAERAPFMPWMQKNIPDQNVVFSTPNTQVMGQAVRDGVGIGFLPQAEAENFYNLTEVMAPQEEWLAPVWICTHVDLHRSAKVQAFLDILYRNPDI